MSSSRRLELERQPIQRPLRKLRPFQSLNPSFRVRASSHSEGCRVFEVVWGSYIAYSVRNESYVANDKYEQCEGRLLVKYSKSRFLDYVASGTFATAEYPGPFTHWGIICGNHIIDVASTEEPVVGLLPNGA